MVWPMHLEGAQIAPSSDLWTSQHALRRGAWAELDSLLPQLKGNASELTHFLIL